MSQAILAIILYIILYYNFTTQRVAGSPQQYKNQLLWALLQILYKHTITLT
jgi:hypothetical protein